MKKLVAFDFACNDPDNGLFAGEVWSAQYGDAEMERARPVKFTALPDRIRIHRNQFRIVGRVEWIGNWCWNRYWLPRVDAKALLVTLRSHGWRATCAPVHFSHWMNSDGTLS